MSPSNRKDQKLCVVKGGMYTGNYRSSLVNGKLNFSSNEFSEACVFGDYPEEMQYRKHKALYGLI